MAKYVLTKLERIVRTEKVKYSIEIPEHIIRKRAFAIEQVEENNYSDYQVEIIDSDLLDEDIADFKRDTINPKF